MRRRRVSETRLSDSAHFREASPFLRTMEAPSLRLLPPDFVYYL